jgi:hypothetical protein
MNGSENQASINTTIIMVIFTHLLYHINMTMFHSQNLKGPGWLNELGSWII